MRIVQQTIATRQPGSSGTSRVTRLSSRKRRRSLLRSTRLWALVIGIGLLIALLVVFVQQENSIANLKDATQAVQTQIQDEQQTLDQLERRSEYASSERAIENAARDTLGMVKQGEILFQSKAQSGNDTAQGADPIQTAQPSSTPTTIEQTGEDDAT